MAWGNCPTHGPIQSARAVLRGGVVTDLVCDCGLSCESFTPEGFVEHSTLVEKHDAALGPEELESPDPESALEALPGGYFSLPSGEKVKGKKAALEALSGLSEAPEE